jgi:hypothetical protein
MVGLAGAATLLLLLPPAGGVMAQLEAVQLNPTVPGLPGVKVMLVVPCPAVIVAFVTDQL